jgi:hypothetical protein
MNIGGSTLNSRLGLGLGFETDTQGKPKFNEAVAYNNLFAKCISNSNVIRIFSAKKGSKGVLLVIDEVFMVDSRIMALVNEVAEYFKVKVQWLILGDPLQLPVVGDASRATFKKADLLKPNEQVTQKNCLINSFARVRLTETQRQADKAFVAELEALRLGGRDLGAILIGRLKDITVPEGALHAFYTNKQVVDYNELALATLKGAGNKCVVFNAEVRDYFGAAQKSTGVKDRNGQFIRDFDWVVGLAPFTRSMEVVVNMNVMFRKNLHATDTGITVISSSTGVIPKGKILVVGNGTMGTVLDIFGKTVRVALKNGMVVDVEQIALDVPSRADDEMVGSFKQLPFHAAEAITIGKLQGLTIDSPLVIHQWVHDSATGREVPLPRSCTGYMYVGCSRVTDPKYLYFGRAGITASNMIAFRLLQESIHVDREALDWLEVQLRSEDAQ